MRIFLSIVLLGGTVLVACGNRELQRVSTNHLGGTDRVTTAYDFRGLPVRTLREHSVPGKPAVSELMESEYDRQGRHLRTTHSINGATARTLRADSYDELGRMDRTLLHGSETMAVSYGYDVRSRPASMRSDVYSQTLSFTPSGIVSRKEWKANGPSESRRSYDYTYNGLGFLTRARYDDASGGTDNFTVGYSYDLQGNLLTVERRGRYDDHPRHNLIDDMTYEYSGNQLTRISDAQPGPYTYNTVTFRDDADLDTEFTYDGCGNMTSDLNRGVTAISYQPSTGRPVEIRTSAGAVTRHLRDAAGNRLRSVRTVLSQTPEAPALELLLTAANSLTDSTVTDRVEGRYVYEEGELVRIEHADGYINNPLAAEPDYRYFVRDHTGSNVAVTGTPHGGSYQINHYYPFGMPLGCDYCPWVQDRKFGGKELDRVSGLNLMDFEARIYDPTTGRFYTPDPLSHINYWLSPYAFCANSPISHSDPTGMDIYYIGPNGSVNNIIKNKDIDQFILVDEEGERRRDSNGDYLQMSFDYGTIKYQPYQHMKDKVFDIFQVRGDDNAIELFEFFSVNISNQKQTEYSLVMTGEEGEKGLNFVSTGHTKGSEPAMSELYTHQLEYNYYIRRMVHCHPKSDYAGDSNMEFSGQVNDRQRRNIPQWIYHIKTSKYIKFNSVNKHIGETTSIK